MSRWCFESFQRLAIQNIFYSCLYFMLGPCIEYCCLLCVRLDHQWSGLVSRHWLNQALFGHYAIFVPPPKRCMLPHLLAILKMYFQKTFPFFDALCSLSFSPMSVLLLWQLAMWETCDRRRQPRTEHGKRIYSFWVTNLFFNKYCDTRSGKVPPSSGASLEVNVLLVFSQE